MLKSVIQPVIDDIPIPINYDRPLELTKKLRDACTLGTFSALLESIP